MIGFTTKYSGNNFSQNGEDFLIQECIKRIKPHKKTCVEFGAHNGSFCSNTANLIINHGWEGKMIEGDEMLFAELLNNQLLPDDLDCVNAFVTTENVNHLIPDCTVLSVDIDGEDARVWAAYNKKPAIVIIEINSSIHPTERHWSKERGSSYLNMVEIGEGKGYFLLAHTGNLIWVDEKYKKLFPEIKGDPKTDWQEYFKMDWL